MSNVLTGLGKSGKDKNVHLEVGDYRILTDEELTALYTAGGLSGKIVDVVAHDSTRNGWELKNDEDGEIELELARIGFTAAINQALIYSRLYRGAVIVMVTQTGKLDKPIPLNGGVVTHLRVYSAARIDLYEEDIVDDPNSKYFEDVEKFKIRKLRGGYMEVHRERCMVFKGEVLPDYETSLFDLTYHYWGLGAVQKIWIELSYYESGEQGVSNLMQEAVIGKYKMSNLKSILAQGTKEAIDKILTRLETINTSKSIIRAVLLAEDEDYIRDGVNFGGIPEIMDRQQIALSAVANIPVTRLFGRSPAGMNSTGQSDERMYYDDVKSRQEWQMRKEMDRCIQYVGSYIYGGDKKEYGIEEFRSLWELTEKEKSEIDKMNAETDAIYLDRGVLYPDQVIEERFPEKSEEINSSYLKAAEEEIKKLEEMNRTKVKGTPEPVEPGAAE